MAKILDVHLQALKSRDAIELGSDKWRILIPQVLAPPLSGRTNCKRLSPRSLRKFSPRPFVKSPRNSLC